MRQRTILEWRQQTHNSIKEQITNFRNTFMSSLGSTTMMQRGVYNSTVANLTGKNSDAVTIATTLGSSVGTISIGKIESLAKGANVTSTGSVSQGGSGFLASAKLGSLTFDGGGQINFDAGGKAVIKINDTEIEISEDDTISDMISKVNKSDAGVTMSYDRLADRFTLEGKTVGGPAFGISDVSGNALSMFGLQQSNVKAGTPARLQINGEWVSSDTNTFDFRGMRITLHRTTNGTVTTGGVKTGDDDEDITVSLRRDATDAVNRIKGFIDAYNSIIKKIEGLVRERKTSGEASYLPLTDEEKSMMSEKQIEEWEAIARKGILRGDQGLQGLANSLRSALFQSVQSAGMSPSDIGLTTGNFFGGTGGQIILDEDKLRAALEEDPEKVADIFAGTEGNRGFLWRMNTVMGDYMNKSQTITLKNLEDSIRRANEQMTKMQQKMYQEEDKLYKQFAAMETALSKMQSQGDWMSAMLGMNK